MERIKIVKAEIDSCRKCPFVHKWIEQGCTSYYCEKEKRFLPEKNNKISIPQWCPLEDKE